MCDGSDDDITNPDGCNAQGDAAEVEQPTPNPDKKQNEKKGENTRTDYSKNKPYTSDPTYIKLGDYFTLPLGGRLVNWEGKPDTWLYRVLKRIPEHFEEIFYEVALVTLPNGDRVKTMEYDDQIIPGCCFDLDLIVFVLTEHFCYNTPFKGIVRKLNNLGLNMNDKTLGDYVHRAVTSIVSLQRHILGNLSCVSMRKKSRKSSFYPAILSFKLSCKREQNQANLIEFCRVQPIIIKDKC